MEFRNLTPFAAMQYAMLDVNDVEKHVVVMKVGYQLQLSGKGVYQARVRDDNAVPLCLEDEFTGKMNTSSARYESDLAPDKPACDVIITATAWAPDGLPCTEIPVRVEIKGADGSILLAKHLRVSGERYFEQHAVTQRWSLSEPEPFLSYPIRWEGAFGGECRIEPQEEIPGTLPTHALLTQEQREQHPHAPDAPLAHEVCMNNPLGRGFITPWYQKAKQPRRFPAPRITDPRKPCTAADFAAQIAGEIATPCLLPAGLGITGRVWQPRLALAGTYDDVWQQKRHPYLPADFDFRYWNCAPPDQQIPYPTLPLSVNLEGLSPDEKIQFSLPEHTAFILLRMNNGLWLPQPTQIDTIDIDAERLEVTICWRALIPANAQVRVIEARYETDTERLPGKIYPMLFPAKSPTEQAV